MSNQGAPLWDEGNLFAENDLSSKQFYAVELSAQNRVDVCDGATDKAFGILQNDPKAGQAAVVRKLGKSKAVVDGNAAAIAVGDWLGTDANGKLVKKTTNNDIVIAQANEVATTDGAIIEVWVYTPMYFGA